MPDWEEDAEIKEGHDFISFNGLFDEEEEEDDEKQPKQLLPPFNLPKDVFQAKGGKEFRESPSNRTFIPSNGSSSSSQAVASTTPAKSYNPSATTNNGNSLDRKPQLPKGDLRSTILGSGGLQHKERDGGGHYLAVDSLTKLPIPPWTPPNRNYSTNYVTFLDEEILDYVEFVKPTIAEHEMRLFTLERLRLVIVKIWPNCKLACFGSFETKLYLPSSDLDCVLMDPSISSPTCLYTLRDALSQAEISEKIDVIAKAKVPILKYFDSLTKFAVDISVNMQNGLDAANVVKEFTKDAKIGQATRTLMLVLKQFLTQRFLNEVFSGGLSSYSLVCMIVSFLKLHPKIQTGEIDPMKNIGILLLEFFELYGKSFNYNDVAINLYKGDPLYLTRRFMANNSFSNKITAISIIDPQDENNDVSVGSYNFPQIKNSFMKAFMVLSSMIGAGYEKKVANREQARLNRVLPEDKDMITILGSILSLDRGVLERREVIETLYERYLNGELTTAPSKKMSEKLSGKMPAIEPKKRKWEGGGSNKSSSAPTEVVYIGDESDEEVDMELDENSDDQDITSYYKMNGKVKGEEFQESFGSSKKRK